MSNETGERACYHRAVRRRVLQLAAMILLLVAVGSQVSELMDRWDHTMQTGNDIESVLVVLALTTGAVLAAVKTTVVDRDDEDGAFEMRPAEIPIATGISRTIRCCSPPLSLRI